MIEIYPLKFNDETIKRIQKDGVIAFDVETTGFSAKDDRIVELGAVKFENGVEISSFGTLVNPGCKIPAAATNVNHITNAMLSVAPCEESVYSRFIEYLGDALAGETIICAHNASFDMHFIAETLMRLGYSGRLEYLDTLTAARMTIKDLCSYRQSVLCNYLGLRNDNAHRAEDDARVCGKILYALIPLKPIDKENRTYTASPANYEKSNLNDQIKYISVYSQKSPADYEKNKPNNQEKYVCAYVQKLLSDAGEDISYLSFYKNSTNYVDIRCLYDVFKFKIVKKGAYIIVESNLLDKVSHSLKTESCTSSEGASNTRVFFTNPYELDQIKDLITSCYNKAWQSADLFYKDHPNYEADTESKYGYIPYRITLEEVNSLISSINPSETMFEDLIAIKEKENAEKVRLAEEKRAAKELERQLKKAEREAKSAENSGKNKRAIIQMDDNFEIIKSFDSISAAVKETGINSKSIRDAANGVQKHAGGFVWKYKDSIE